MVDFLRSTRSTTPEQAQAHDSHLKTLIMQATNQAADGCLNKDTTEDHTVRISAKNTVLNFDTQVYADAGNSKHAAQIEHHQHLLINTRRDANALFATALDKLSPDDRNNAIRIMNLVSEQLNKEALNKREANYLSSPESSKISSAEYRVSEAKMIFAAQIESGLFEKNMVAYAGNGMQAQCVHKDADVVDYAPK